MPLSSAAKIFLAKILTIENSVTSKNSKDCIICHERCGSLSPETGLMEVEVRLPCNHTVGSACIATWLTNSNTCPLCRRELFSRQPRPNTRTVPEMMQLIRHQNPNYDARRHGELTEALLARIRNNSDLPDAVAFAITYSQSLHLRYPIACLASGIARKADFMFSDRGATSESIAAASVYMASHILNQPRSLTEIGRLAGVSERTIHSVYRATHYKRYILIDEKWPIFFGGTTLADTAEAVPLLTWPPLQQELIDGQGEDEGHVELINNSRASAIGDLELVQMLCISFYETSENPLRIRDANPNRYVWRTARKAAKQMETMELNLGTVNPWTIAAACTYMASHIELRPTTVEEISGISGVPASRIRDTYEVMYRSREQIVQEAWVNSVFWTRKFALRSLPRP